MREADNGFLAAEVQPNRDHPHLASPVRLENAEQGRD
jgi:hypothetical protein